MLVFKGKIARINHVLYLPDFLSLFLRIFWKISNNVISPHTHRSVTSLQYRSQSFQNVFEYVYASFLGHSTLFPVFDVLLQSLVVFLYEMGTKWVRCFHLFDFYDVWSWKVKGIGKYALVELKSFFDFVILKFGQIIDLNEVIIALISFSFGLIDVEERFDGDPLLSCDNKIFIGHFRFFDYNKSINLELILWTCQIIKILHS